MATTAVLGLELGTSADGIVVRLAWFVYAFGAAFVTLVVALRRSADSEPVARIPHNRLALGDRGEHSRASVHEYGRRRAFADLVGWVGAEAPRRPGQAGRVSQKTNVSASGAAGVASGASTAATVSPAASASTANPSWVYQCRTQSRSTDSVVPSRLMAS